jgi:hypothetical protein
MKTLIKQLEDIIKQEIPNAEVYFDTHQNQKTLGFIKNGKDKVGFTIEPEMSLQEVLNKVIAPVIANLKNN